MDAARISAAHRALREAEAQDNAELMISRRRAFNRLILGLRLDPRLRYHISTEGEVRVLGKARLGKAYRL
jgi:hypothetical protein